MPFLWTGNSLPNSGFQQCGPVRWEEPVMQRDGYVLRWIQSGMPRHRFTSSNRPQADLSIAESMLAQRSPDAEPICQDKEHRVWDRANLPPQPPDPRYSGLNATRSQWKPVEAGRFSGRVTARSRSRQPGATVRPDGRPARCRYRSGSSPRFEKPSGILRP